MAREVIERLVDDLDGGVAVETVQFGLDGANYEIDLNKRNAAALRKALEGYVAAGRRTSTSRTTKGRARRSAANGASKSGVDLAALRVWAAANSINVASRGRVPQAIVDQYRAAGGK